MTIARKLRDAAMGPAPYSLDASSWLVDDDAFEASYRYRQLCEFMQDMTEDECRAFLYLLSMVVRDEK